jgi:hypothetical protein
LNNIIELVKEYSFRQYYFLPCPESPWLPDEEPWAVTTIKQISFQQWIISHIDTINIANPATIASFVHLPTQRCDQYYIHAVPFKTVLT